MFRSFGHVNSSIINGGLPLWCSEGFQVEGGSPSPSPKSSYPTPTLDTNAIRSRYSITLPTRLFLPCTDYDQIVTNSALDPSTDPSAELVLDARSKGRYVHVNRSYWPFKILCRYLGADPEPRPGLSSGHIPHSLSLPFQVFLSKHTGADGAAYSSILPPSELQKALEDALGTKLANLAIKGEIPVVTSCGSGMTAAILWLGLKLLGVGKIGLYDEVSCWLLLTTSVIVIFNAF